MPHAEHLNRDAGSANASFPKNPERHGILDSTLVIGAGAAAIAGLTTWVLLQGGKPVSLVKRDAWIHHPDFSKDSCPIRLQPKDFARLRKAYHICLGRDPCKAR
jgi:hypothetical protein